MKYRKKPVVINAYQYNPENPDQGLAEALRLCERPHQREGMNLIIHTLEGDMKAIPNDWIIFGIKGEPYPCKPDIFEQTYERVE